MEPCGAGNGSAFAAMASADKEIYRRRPDDGADVAIFRVDLWPPFRLVGRVRRLRNAKRKKKRSQRTKGKRKEKLFNGGPPLRPTIRFASMISDGAVLGMSRISRIAFEKYKKKEKEKKRRKPSRYARNEAIAKQVALQKLDETRECKSL